MKATFGIDQRRTARQRPPLTEVEVDPETRTLAEGGSVDQGERSSGHVGHDRGAGHDTGLDAGDDAASDFDGLAEIIRMDDQHGGQHLPRCFCDLISGCAQT